jgi:hypothetical protein
MTHACVPLRRRVCSNLIFLAEFPEPVYYHNVTIGHIATEITNFLTTVGFIFLFFFFFQKITLTELVKNVEAVFNFDLRTLLKHSMLSTEMLHGNTPNFYKIQNNINIHAYIQFSTL